MSNGEERELGWDDPIENDGSDFVVAPAGDYDFEVVNFERGRHNPKPGGKLPACNKAIITIRIPIADGDTVDIRHNLFLHSRCEGMLCAFFIGIGQRKHGEQLCPDWNNIVGSRGTCKITTRKWKNKDGTEIESNDIKKFYEPKPGSVPQPPQYKQPAATDEEVPF